MRNRIPAAATDGTHAGGSATIPCVVAAALVVACAQPLAGQPPALHQPRSAVLFGGGVRDAGDVGDASWLVTLGLRRTAGESVAWSLSASHTRVGETVCPPGSVTGCVPQGRATVSSLDAGLEFLYGRFLVQPYGVASLGLAHLRRPVDDIGRWGFAYSTGLGLSAQAGPRAWLYGEVRWRQERFGNISVHGPAGILGVRLGL